VNSFSFCASAFWKGCGGTFFAKKVPPQKSPHKRILLTIPTFFDMIKVEKIFQKILAKSVTFGTKGRDIK
jgi:hypothetical protein